MTTQYKGNMEFLKSLFESFKHAYNGIKFCVQHEKNIRIHIVAVIVVMFVSQFYELSSQDYVLLILTCLAVIVTEMLNTAIEVVIDKVSPTYSALAKVGKDVAAGAVFVSAITAVVVAIIMFNNSDGLIRLWNYFTTDIFNFAMLIGSLCVFYLFVSSGKKRNIKGKKK